ncbi:unnamed protein product, partial [Meganyctiphanes norvegica]
MTMISHLGLPVAVLATAATVVAILDPSITAQGNQEVSATVYVVVGKSVRLPCRGPPNAPPDTHTVVFWYKDGIKKPVYSVDFRSADDAVGREYASSTVLGGRAQLGGTAEEGGRWSLLVSDAHQGDDGLYRCRLDFQAHPTYNARVHLKVVELPVRVRLLSLGGAPVFHEVSAMVGHPLILTCRVEGGFPLQDYEGCYITENLNSNDVQLILVNYQMNILYIAMVDKGVYVTNTLHIEKVTVELLQQNLSCQATNNPEMPPMVAIVRLIQTESSVSIQMSEVAATVSGGKELLVWCRAGGTRPPPTITWWLRNTEITENMNQTVELSSTLSVLKLTPTASEDRARLSCRASSPTLPHLQASQNTTLTVYYVPVAAMHLRGSGAAGPGEQDLFQEGATATLTCDYRANPRAYNVTFMFNGRRLSRGGVVPGSTNNSVTLLGVSHADAGLYTCIVANAEGDGQSNAVALQVHYRPVCAWSEDREVAVLGGTEVTLRCQMRSAPSPLTFTWWTRDPDHDDMESSGGGTGGSELSTHEDSGSSSLARLTVGNQTRVFCGASNAVGHGERLCIFSLNVVDLPGPVLGCVVEGVTADSASVTCSPGEDGGLAQTFYIEVVERDGGAEVVYNSSASEPRWQVGSLSPGREYMLKVYAAHRLGHGQKTSLFITTAGPHLQPVGQEILTENPASVQETTTIIPSSMFFSHHWLPWGMLAAGVVGVIIGVAVGVTVLLVWRSRRSRPQPTTKQERESSADSLIEHTMPHTDPAELTPELEMMSPGPDILKKIQPDNQSVLSLPQQTSPSADMSTCMTLPRRSASVRDNLLHSHGADSSLQNVNQEQKVMAATLKEEREGPSKEDNENGFPICGSSPRSLQPRPNCSQAQLMVSPLLPPMLSSSYHQQIVNPSYLQPIVPCSTYLPQRNHPLDNSDIVQSHNIHQSPKIHLSQSMNFPTYTQVRVPSSLPRPMTPLNTHSFNTFSSPPKYPFHNQLNINNSMINISEAHSTVPNPYTCPTVPRTSTILTMSHSSQPISQLQSIEEVSTPYSQPLPFPTYAQHVEYVDPSTRCSPLQPSSHTSSNTAHTQPNQHFLYQTEFVQNIKNEAIPNVDLIKLSNLFEK